MEILHKMLSFLFNNDDSCPNELTVQVNLTSELINIRDVVNNEIRELSGTFTNEHFDNGPTCSIANDMIVAKMKLLQDIDAKINELYIQHVNQLIHTINTTTSGPVFANLSNDADVIDGDDNKKHD